MKSPIHLLSAVLALAVLTACGSPSTPVPPSLELPRAPEDLAAARKGNKVNLSWTPPVRTTDGLNVRLKKLGATLICRGVNDFPMPNCAHRIGQEPPTAPPPRGTEEKTPPPKIQYMDRLPAGLQQMYPTGAVIYAVEATNWRGRSAGLSNQVKVPLAPTLPPPGAVHAEVTAKGIVVEFPCMGPAPETPALHYNCRVYRQEAGPNPPIQVAEVPVNKLPCAANIPEKDSLCAILDHGIEWEAKYAYWVTPVTEIIKDGKRIAEVEGDDSPPVTVLAHDIFPPAVPGGLEAVASGIGQRPFIDLTWTPNTDADLAGYNIYRQKQDATGWTKINQRLVTVPAFRDENVAPGQTYIYSVSAMDVRGNESARGEPASEPVP